MAQWNQLLTALTKTAIRSGSGLRRPDSFVSFDASGVPISGTMTDSGSGLFGLAQRAFEQNQLQNAHPVMEGDLEEARLLCAAMLSAAFGQRMVNDRERLGLLEELSRAGIAGETLGWVGQQIDMPSSIEQLSKLARTPQLANDIYASFLVGLGPTAKSETPRLERLAGALALTREQTKAWHQSLGI